ncbi:MAG: peptidoglycan DD-metalloendopeptidase family protein [Chitinophagaceae bacterium]|nr:peptidoglycan DD-metalloendopeptidase family protein [Chitinophagaceae bacterium]
MNDLVMILKQNKQHFSKVVPFDSGNDKLMPLNFTKANHELTDDILADVKKFCLYMNDKLNKGHARYGVGGYAEHRTIYSRSKVFDGKNPGEEPRRLHLGIDIWGKPNTAVIAPLDGIVHSFAHNDQPGDYGVTIILSHLLQGISFYSLYGHLSLNSIKNLREGNRIMKGDIFAEFGIPAENGHWPPHLHFQVIKDLEGWSGDYPGVCKYSEGKKYLPNCPDPDLILRMNRYL